MCQRHEITALNEMLSATHYFIISTTENEVTERCNRKEKKNQRQLSLIQHGFFLLTPVKPKQILCYIRMRVRLHSMHFFSPLSTVTQVSIKNQCINNEDVCILTLYFCIWSE